MSVLAFSALYFGFELIFKHFSNAIAKLLSGSLEST